LPSSVRAAGKLRKKAFAALEISMLIVSIWLVLLPHSTFGANQITWTDTIKLYKDATTVNADIRTFTNNETFPVDVTVQLKSPTPPGSIRILEYYKLSANGTDFIIISEGKVILSGATYYGLKPGEKLCFTVEAKPTNSANEGNTATVEVEISYLLPAKTMHVERIDFKQAGTSKLDITVTIYDNAGSPVTGATVYMDITYPGGSVLSVSAVTSDNGIATYQINRPAKGTYTVTVTNVTHATLTYDPSANKETTDSYTVT